MPGISKKSRETKEIACELISEFLISKIGDIIEIKLKDETLVFKRIKWIIETFINLKD